MIVKIHGQAFEIHASGFAGHDADAETAEAMAERALGQMTADDVAALDDERLLTIGMNAAAEITKSWRRKASEFGNAAAVDIVRVA